MELRTRRLRLREIDDRDIDNFMRHLNYPEIARFLYLDYPFTNDSAEQLFDDFDRLKKYNPRRGYYFAIDFDRTFAGYIDLEGVNGADRRGYLSYWLSGFFWGERVMSEVMDIVIPFAFNYLDLKNLSACVAEQNLNSIALLKSKGFRVSDEDRGFFFSQVDEKSCRSAIFNLSPNLYFSRAYEKN